MAIHFTCPHCNKELAVRDEFAGKNGSCPSCKQRILVPAAPQQVPNASEQIESNVEGPESSLQDFFSQISQTSVPDSHQSQTARKSKSKWSKPAIAAILGLCSVVVIGAYIFIPRPANQVLLGVWQLDKETGGMFSEENSRGRQPAVEFLAGGKMLMHNWHASLEGKWKLDESKTPPAFECNWDTDAEMSPFSAIEFPTRQTMLLRRQMTTFSINMDEGTQTETPNEVTLHFRRLNAPPPKLSKDKIAKIEALLKKQREMQELNNADPDSDEAKKVWKESDDIDKQIEILKSP